MQDSQKLVEKDFNLSKKKTENFLSYSLRSSFRHFIHYCYSWLGFNVFQT